MKLLLELAQMKRPLHRMMCPFRFYLLFTPFNFCFFHGGTALPVLGANFCNYGYMKL